MYFGLDVSPAGSWGEPRKLAELAAMAERSGWDGVFLEDYIVHPLAPETYDPWVALTAVALATERVRLGTLVTPVPRRSPFKLAAEAMSVDHLSSGRMVLGVGVGDWDLRSATSLWRARRAARRRPRHDRRAVGWRGGRRHSAAPAPAHCDGTAPRSIARRRRPGRISGPRMWLRCAPRRGRASISRSPRRERPGGTSSWRRARPRPRCAGESSVARCGEGPGQCVPLVDGQGRTVTRGQVWCQRSAFVR
jgi:alkanesulfonate monooxygenase SsuD/methylene tetrahydromethanopterin reductase-like flavin-dependent oxidoreductase (luciferase family)